MKKALIATTALVAVGFGSAATAAEWETGVSGYYYLGLGLSSSDLQDGVGVLRDGEVHVDASITADNGITFDARVELESFSTGDQIDENWGRIKSSFGNLMIGGNDDQLYENGQGTIYAPGARIGYYDAFSLTNVAGSSFNGPALGVDGLGIHYQTPNFAGFYAFGTYIPNIGTDGAGDTNNPQFEGTELYAVGAAYTGDFGDFGVGLSGGYLDLDGAGDLWNIHGNVSFGGFKVAAAYEDDFVDDEYAIGAQYATGPWSVAGGYSHNEGSDLSIAAGWVNYALAPGVLVTAGVEYAERNNAENFGGLTYLTLRF